MAFTERSLSTAQIQYLKIEPKAGESERSKRIITEAIKQEKNRYFGADVTNGLNKIPKLTYGQFEKTVNNFGVLINKNFGNETRVHQVQKFGKMAFRINKIMLQEKDKPIYNEKKNALLKKLKDRSDNRTCIKTTYDLNGQKLHVTLKSFAIQSERSVEMGMPMPNMRFLITHVNSSRLTKIIEPALKTDGVQFIVEFDQIQSRASHLANSETKYQNLQYCFEKMGQTFRVELPSIQFQHIQSNFSQKVQILNKQILQTLDSNLDNVDVLVEKYLEIQTLEKSFENLPSQQASYQLENISI